jgi:hypothetical protein
MPDVAAETKICAKCKEEKPVEEFAWRVQALNRRHSYCRPCRSDYHREAKKQDGVLRKRCPMCGIEKPRTPRYWNFSRRDGYRDLVIDSYCRLCKITYCKANARKNAAQVLPVALDTGGTEEKILSAFRANDLSSKALYEALLPLRGEAEALVIVNRERVAMGLPACVVYL